MEILPRNVLLASWINAIRRGQAGFDDLYGALGGHDRFGELPVHEVSGAAHAFFVGHQELLQVGSTAWLLVNHTVWEPSSLRAPEIQTHSIKEASRLLVTTIDEALALLAPIESASDRGTPHRAQIREALTDLLVKARRVFPDAIWQESTLIERSLTVLLVSVIAGTDIGGAVTAPEIVLRSREIDRLRSASLEALILGTQAWSVQHIP
ncbi:MAG: hypothetical protein EBU43_00435 [Actinobacteria bacterium]|nr:hypothetical protein [Actinomycetota bacterium]NBP90834.1 hypothetical protein [Actinomycetota bacterium]